VQSCPFARVLDFPAALAYGAAEKVGAREVTCSASLVSLCSESPCLFVRFVVCPASQSDPECTAQDGRGQCETPSGFDVTIVGKGVRTLGQIKYAGYGGRGVQVVIHALGEEAEGLGFHPSLDCFACLY
jgi:hypothetical protein